MGYVNRYARLDPGYPDTIGTRSAPRRPQDLVDIPRQLGTPTNAIRPRYKNATNPDLLFMGFTLQDWAEYLYAKKPGFATYSFSYFLARIQDVESAHTWRQYESLWRYMKKCRPILPNVPNYFNKGSAPAPVDEHLNHCAGTIDLTGINNTRY